MFCLREHGADSCQDPHAEADWAQTSIERRLPVKKNILSGDVNTWLE